MLSSTRSNPKADMLLVIVAVRPRAPTPHVWRGLNRTSPSSPCPVRQRECDTVGLAHQCVDPLLVKGIVPFSVPVLQNNRPTLSNGMESEGKNGICSCWCWVFKYHMECWDGDACCWSVQVYYSCDAYKTTGEYRLVLVPWEHHLQLNSPSNFQCVNQTEFTVFSGIISGL